MYSIFAVILGVSQLVAISVFPAFAAKFPRKLLYTVATGLVVAGYIVFFFAPNTTMLYIGIAGVLLFVGQAFIQTLMLMFLADTVEYGAWKLGKKNEAITFSVQPLINKIGSALATGIVSFTLIFSGIKVDGGTVDAIGPEGQLIVKLAMFAIPLIMIIAGYIVYLKKYKISEEYYANILKELDEK